MDSKDVVNNFISSQIFTNHQGLTQAENVDKSLKKVVDNLYAGKQGTDAQLATIGQRVGNIMDSVQTDEENEAFYITDKEGNAIGKFDSDGLSVTDVKLLKNGTLKSIFSLLSDKVDVENGKSLSTNDYTNAEKTKVESIDNKVDKVEGKTLSTNDFTDALKTKLENSATLEGIDDDNKEVFYIVDSEGNVTAKIDENGVSSVGFNVLKDGELVDILSLIQTNDSLQDLYKDSLYVTDGRGNVAFKVDKDGVDYIGKQGGGSSSSTLVDNGSTRTDIMLNLIFGRSLSYHGDITSRANMHTCLQFDTTDGNYMVLGITEDVINDEEKLDAFFKGLIPSKTGISGTGIAHANRKFMELLRDENGIDIEFDEDRNPKYDFQVVGCNPGVVAVSSGLMNPTSLPYRRLLKVVEYGKKFAEEQNKTFSVGAVCYMEGEERNTYKQRYDKLWAFASNIDHDIRAITGQTENVYLMPYQMACQEGRYNVGSVLAMLQIALDEGTIQGYELESNSYLKNGVDLIDRKYIVMGAIMNSLDYRDSTDHIHATDHSYLCAGAQWGIQLKRTLYDKNPIVPIHVVSHSVVEKNDGKFILALNFHVPVRPLVFDTDNAKCQSQRATSETFGFTLLNTDGDSIIGSVLLRRGQEVVIVTTENPTGLTLWYAKDGWEIGGNLRDSQDITYNMGSLNYKAHNWCPTFSLTI